MSKPQVGLAVAFASRGSRSPSDVGRRADESAGDGILTGNEYPSPLDTFRYNPKEPVPSPGGNTVGTVEMQGPRDQRPSEPRSDLLVYTSEAPVEELEVTGVSLI